MNAPEHTHLHTHDDVHIPTLRRPLKREDYAHIPHWGADLDKANRPAYPMERTPPRLEGAPLPEPAAQHTAVEVLHSNEYPRRPPIVSSALPPKGVSGRMRRAAFGFSENDLRHWLILLAADRVHMVEGLVDDISHGIVPNLYAEMGGHAQMQYNPKGAAERALKIALAAGVMYLVWRRLRRDIAPVMRKERFMRR
jgi:hypothetical protein